jgi:hypothetical protein
MFRPLLIHYQVSVSVKVMNLCPIWIHIMGCLHTIQYDACNKTHRVMYYLKSNWAEFRCRIKVNIENY